MPKKKQKNPASLKAYAQKVHFKKCLEERYGLAINSDSYRQIIAAIQSPAPVKIKLNGHVVEACAIFRARQSNRVTAWDIAIDGISETIPVIYDNLRKTLVTTHPNLSDRVARRSEACNG